MTGAPEDRAGVQVTKGKGRSVCVCLNVRKLLHGIFTHKFNQTKRWGKKKLHRKTRKLLEEDRSRKRREMRQGRKKKIVNHSKKKI